MEEDCLEICDFRKLWCSYCWSLLSALRTIECYVPNSWMIWRGLLQGYRSTAAIMAYSILHLYNNCHSIWSKYLKKFLERAIPF